MDDCSEQRRAWAASGAMALTGRPDGPPLVPPPGVVDRMIDLGRPLDVDVLPLLAERAAFAGLHRGGDVSAGGATRLLSSRDGWVAVSLARPDDLDLVPAWLGVEPDPADPWPAVADAIASRSADQVVEWGALLGLALATVATTAAAGAVPACTTQLRTGATGDRDRPLVVDLSSLWAGPLCARLLRERGARVVKVESVDRPDGARRGPAGFFALMHAGHESVVLDFRAGVDVERLRRLLLSADVVIEASRPRALEQLGIDAADVVTRGPSVWVSITGHGRGGAGRDRVAFGDDAAAGGGLVAHDEAGPCFVADAVADPLSGVAAAAAATAALAAGGGWLIDVSMTAVAAHVAAGAAGLAWRPGDPAEAAAPVAP